MVEGYMSSARFFDTFRSVLECCLPNFLVGTILSGDDTRDVVLK